MTNLVAAISIGVTSASVSLSTLRTELLPKLLETTRRIDADLALMR